MYPEAVGATGSIRVHDIKNWGLFGYISASCRRDIMTFDYGELIQNFEMNIYYDQIARFPRA